MPGLIKTENSTFLGQMKVSISRTPAPKQVHSVISSRAFAISSDTPPTSTHYLYPGSLALPDVRGTRHLTLAINDLPPEILAEIFHSYLFWEDESDLIDPELEGLIPVIEPSSRAAPLLFCQVCSYWREVAISTPSLWSSIALKETIPLNTVKLWLQRSRNHPLSFAVWLSSSPDSSTYKWGQWPELLNLLCGNIDRWQDILVRLPSANEVSSFMTFLLPSKGISPASRLRTLDVSHMSYKEDCMSRETINRLASFPHPTLRRFTWQDGTMPVFRQLDTVMWEGLQQLAFVKVTTGVLCAFLQACPNLLFVNVNTLLASCTSNLPDSRVLAPSLQTLHINGAGGDVTNALQFLIAPQLQRLSYCHTGEPGETGRLVTFLVQSQCHLASLSILTQGKSFNDDAVRHMLSLRIFTSISSISIRIPEEFCHHWLLQHVVSNAAAGRSYAYLEPQNYCYHFGWGDYDFVREYSRYPFLFKGHSHTPKWHVFLSDGPLTSA